MLAYLKPILDQYSHLFEVKVSEKYSLLLIDSDEFNPTDFYFSIGIQSREGKFNIEMKPGSHESVRMGQINELDSSQISIYLIQWLTILNDYNKLDTIFDNPAKYYARSFYQKYANSGFSSETYTFDEFEVLKTNTFLDYLASTIDEVIIQEPDINKRNYYETIINDIKKLKKNLLSHPVNKITERVCVILGKTFSNGFDNFIIITRKVFPTACSKFLEVIFEVGIKTLIEYNSINK